jgi:hypothetical protein
MAYTDIDDPRAYFQATLYTGNSSANVVTNSGLSDLQPDFIWGKCRTTTKSHFWYDSTRGTEKRLISNSTGSEGSNTNGVTAFNSDGFQVDSGNTENDNGEGFVAWQWVANGGTTATNTDGTLNTVAQANQDAGFSIITWTGAGGDRTVGHGLGQAPDMVICKNRTIPSQWLIWHKSLGVGNNLLFLTNASGSGNLVTATPTSTVFQIGSSAEVSNDCVAWCWAEKQGYSKFGKYFGNGSTDGPFVYTGFKPAFLIMKEYSSAGGNWVMFDNKRDTHNVTKHRVFPNLTNADNTTRDYVDLLSNGFKLRDTDADHNQSGESMIYMAFAENPFTTSTGIPATAR